MLKVTERAAEQISKTVGEHPGKFAGLRVGLQDGGCSGYTYLLEFEPEPDEDDIVFEEAGAKVFVSPMHLPYLAGSEVDWTRGDLREGFEVSNPNVKRTCGCGESFDV
ncbi:MAG: iron-sulfur cluster assembly accessory protein [Alphaproteobacteria bacterium]|nr:iron-sulfur cluster assembly accessory protein [Alphaproteobacteria bacterium]MCB9697786.1 iron-sulfur cluster assembly accessory protein [Alphaproteobacteria bacterium]